MSTRRQSLESTRETLGEGEVLFALSGKLDEDSYLPFKEEHCKHLILDLEGIKSLNSSGVRTWIFWAAGVPPEQKVSFRHCPFIVVHQMGLMPNILPINSMVESFFIPYHCIHCSNEFHLKALWGVHFQRNQETQEAEMLELQEELPCPACNKNAEIDINPTHYLAFLRNL